MDKNEVLNKIMSSIEKGYIDINEYDEPDEFNLIKEYVNEHIPKKIYTIFRDEGECSYHSNYVVHVTTNKDNAISTFNKIVEEANNELEKDIHFFETNYIVLVENVEGEYPTKKYKLLMAEWEYDYNQHKTVFKGCRINE